LSNPQRVRTPKVFEPLLAPARYKGAWGGRGSGKSHFFAEEAVLKCAKQPGARILCVREVQKSLKDSAKRLIEDKIASLGFGGWFDLKTSEIGTPGGGLIAFVGMQDHTAESVKSLEGFDVAWVEEAQSLSSRSLELLRPTIRKPGSEIWASWNPRSASDPIDSFLRGVNPPAGARVVRANWSDNPFFPVELEAERQHDRKAKPDRYGHIWEGDYEPVAVGAIWDRATLHTYRRAELPALSRVVVAVDPAVSAEPGSDEHGIVVVAEGQDGRGYVLDDVTLRGTPHQWASRAIAAFDRWDADCIVIERNQGGDMCRHTLHTQRPGVRVVEVTATRGKHVRAEPIAALYSLGRVSHVGTFPELEAQMCQMTAAGFAGEGSPDRCDALVWGLTHLFPAVSVGPAREATREYEPRGEGAWMG
jgi:hypothetical protein